MRNYIIRRLLLTIPTLFLVTVIVFIMIRLLPGDIVDVILSQQEFTGVMSREKLEGELGIDVPIHIQYGRWIGNIVFHGDIGSSLVTGYPVAENIAQRLPVTFELGLLANIISLFFIPIGVYTAIRQDAWGDYIGRTFAILCICVPSFWLATLVIVFPSIWWSWSPPIKYIPFTEDPLGNLGMLIIPATILGLTSSGTMMRMTRTMMLEVLRQDYIRTAWSKGLKERAVIVRHAMKNALIPVITIIGLHIPMMIGGTVILEQIFSLPGMGRLLLTAIQDRDYPIISGVNLLVAAVVLLTNLVVDLTYGFLDPRIRYK